MVTCMRNRLQYICQQEHHIYSSLPLDRTHIDVYIYLAGYTAPAIQLSLYMAFTHEHAKHNIAMQHTIRLLLCKILYMGYRPLFWTVLVGWYAHCVIDQGVLLKDILLLGLMSPKPIPFQYVIELHQ